MKRVALIGDSHAKVVFRYLEPMLGSIQMKPVYTRAENGWSLSKHISRGTLDKVAKSKPDVILVSLGGNNQDINTSSYKSTVDKLLKTAKDIGAKIVWVGPTTSSESIAPNTEKRHAWTHKFLSKYLPSKSVYYIDNRSFTDGGWKKDGVHYPTSFYKKWASRVSKALPKASAGVTVGAIKKIAIWSGIGLFSVGIITVATKLIFGEQ